MNQALLRSVMARYSETQADLAELLKLSLSRTNAKINCYGGAQFTQAEIRAIKDHYNLSAYDVDAIFFAKKVS